jgi:hypothetical protein
MSTYTTERHPVAWFAAEQSLTGMMDRPELQQSSFRTGKKQVDGNI